MFHHECMVVYAYVMHVSVYMLLCMHCFGYSRSCMHCGGHYEVCVIMMLYVCYDVDMLVEMEQEM